jgi:hypothetical protein
MAAFWDPILRAFRTKDVGDNAHDRLHGITSALDHAPATGDDKGKVLYSDPVTGEWTLIAMDAAKVIELKVVSDTMNPITGNGIVVFCIPDAMNGMKLFSAAAYLTTAGSGTTTVQVRNASSSNDMLSTAITIDTNELTSYTATQSVVNALYAQVATGNLIAIDVDATAPASKGLGVILTFKN